MSTARLYVNVSQAREHRELRPVVTCGDDVAMPRPKRIAYAGAHYHITDRGNRKADIFLCGRDWRLFIKRLGEVCTERHWRCLAYCLMTNHYHLVIRTDVSGLAEGMRDLNARYAEHFNLAYDCTGHVFQGRYRPDIIESEEYLMEAIRYVELNPVRARMCAQPSQWNWSSYNAVVGVRTHRPWFDRAATLAAFASEATLGLSRYVEFIAQGDPDEPLANTKRRRERRAREQAIRAKYSSGTSVERLATQFGVSKKTIFRALRAKQGHGGV